MSDNGIYVDSALSGRANGSKSQLAVAQIATPPVHVNGVPVSMSTAGNVAVSPLPGLLAAGGTYVSSTESPIFTNADVFAHTMRTNSPSFVLSDDYDIVQTLDLAPDHVYFVNVYAGCNFSLKGTWACDGHATTSFHLDPAKFDEQMGGNSFELSQYFAVPESPNLVPNLPRRCSARLRSVRWRDALRAGDSRVDASWHSGRIGLRRRSPVRLRSGVSHSPLHRPGENRCNRLQHGRDRRFGRW